jgi:hypothetical protein
MYYIILLTLSYFINVIANASTMDEKLCFAIEEIKGRYFTLQQKECEQLSHFGGKNEKRPPPSSSLRLNEGSDPPEQLGPVVASS